MKVTKAELKEIRKLQGWVTLQDPLAKISKQRAMGNIRSLLCSVPAKELQKFDYVTIALAINDWVERIDMNDGS